MNPGATCNLGSVTFALGSSSTRCQEAGSITYTATAANASSIVYTLDAASLAGGNTINASTGEVTYVASWSGTSTITATASATGCADQTATHTVTINSSVATPVFNIGASSNRCIGAGNVTYAATAANSSSISYALDAASLAGGNTIDANTGVVTYAATWTGTSTITATATGCNSSTTANHTVTIDNIIAVTDSVSAVQGVPVSFNVLTNDICDINPASITLVSSPSLGILQDNGNGNFTYQPIGTFSGEITFEYQVCSNGSTPICKQATVVINIAESLDEPCAIANTEKIYYMPFPENNAQLKQSLLSAANTNLLTANVRNITSIVVPYPGTVVIYDNWEDGYEADIKNPIQITTKVWGDGDLTNGVAPGYPTDIIPAGAYIEFDETFPWNRTTSELAFDGKDKIYASYNVSITKVTGDGGTTGSTNLFDIQNVKTAVPDITKYGQYFVMPFGENVNRSGSSNVFKYTGLFVNAAEDGTIVELDYNGDGTTDVTSPTLNEGEVWFYNGQGSTPGVNGDVNTAIDIKSGAVVQSNKDVGVNLIFGGIDNYGTRNIPVFPAQFYGSDYLTPVYSAVTANPAYAYFVNPNSTAITLNYTRAAGSPLTGTISVPANNGVAWFNLNQNSGVRFTSDDGSPFTAVVIVDDGADGKNYDWAYNMTPVDKLTDMGSLGWAPGTSNLTANYAPAWVTATTATTVYVKYDGNITSGGTASPCGAYYDVSYPLAALNALKIKNPSNDNSGMAIFTCDGTPISIVWGQEPGSPTPTASPALDVGYRVEAICKQKNMFARFDTKSTIGNTPVVIDVQQNDFGFLVIKDPSTINNTGLLQPTNGTVVLNPDNTFTYTPNIGFYGIDTFEYSICAQAPDENICATTKVYVRVNCSDIVGQDVLKGAVFADVNIDQAANAGDYGLANIPVQLYNDANANGILDGSDPLVSSQNTDANGNYNFNITQNNTYLDQFTTNGSGAGSDGTLSWTSAPWNEIVESNGFATGSVSVTGNKLRIAGNGATTQTGARRTANLTGAVKATLTYDFSKNTFSSAARDWVEVQVSNASNGTYSTLARYDGTQAASATNVSFDITSFASANTTVRIIESDNANFISTEYVEFDNVQIKYYTEEHFIVKIDDNVENYNITTPTAPTYHASSYSAVFAGACTNDFGLGRADLAVEKTADTTIAFVGEQITYTINVTNNGPTATESVEITDVLPTGLTYVSHTTSAGTFDQGSGKWSLTRLDNLESQTLTITATTTETALPGVINYANVTASSQPDNDTTNNIDSVALLVISNTTNAINDENATWMNVPVDGNVSTNDFDLEGHTQTIGSFLNPDGSGSTITSGASVAGVDETGAPVTDAGQLYWNPDGTYTYIPADGFIGSISVPYTTCDNGSTPVCDTAILTITVAPSPNVTNSVIANNDEYISQEGADVNGNILTNDADPQNNTFTVTSYVYDSNGDGTLDATGSIGTSTPVGGYDDKGVWVANAGTLTQSADGTMLFEPTAGFYGTVSYDYTITDNGIPVATDNAAVVINVTHDQNGPANDPPFAGDDFAVAELNTPVDGNFIGNDSDPNNNPLSIKDENGNTVTIVPGGPHTPINTVNTKNGGTIEFFADGTYNYTPPTNYVGPDLVEYEICDVTTIDPQPLCTNATIHLLVKGVMIAGTVYVDGDGITDNNISESNSVPNTGTNAGGTLYANLTTSTGQVLQSVPVQADGTYRFDNVGAGDFKVVLTSQLENVGTTLAGATLPSSWVTTGENQNNADNNNYGTVDGINEITVSNASLSEVNFGIDQTPTSTAVDYTLVATPTVDDMIALNGIGNNPPLISGNDPEDGAYTGVTGTTLNAQGVVITSLPTNGELYYNGTLVTQSDIDNGTLFADPSLFEIKITDDTYTTTTFEFAYVDAAGKKGVNTTYKINFNTPLPITLLSFDAEKVDHTSLLTWITASERNAKGFDVERSADAKTWSTIGFVASKAENGNSTSKITYTFNDVKVLDGANYYRLKLIEQNGTSTYSTIKVLHFNDNQAISVYPNPATNLINISSLKGKESIRIYNVAGQLLFEQKATTGINTIDIQTLASGTYHLSIVDENGVRTRFKITKL